MHLQHYLFPRITIDDTVCFGRPCLRGLRMPVASILEYLSSGMTPEDILREFPFLEREDITQALAYSASIGLERASDQEIAAVARENHETILAHDLDYGSLLAFSGESGPSVVIFRIQPMTPAAMRDSLCDN